MPARDYNAEFKDATRKYAYDFDTVLRRYIMRALDPFLPAGRALEMGCYTGEMTELIAARYDDKQSSAWHQPRVHAPQHCNRVVEMLERMHEEDGIEPFRYGHGLEAAVDEPCATAESRARGRHELV